MRPEDKERWLGIVGGKIQKAKAAVSTPGKEIGQARETSDARVDPAFVWAALDQVDQKNGVLKSLEAFQTELQEAGPTDKVEPGAQVKVAIDGVEEELLVMRTKVNLPNIRVITLDTPLVEAIKGQKIAFRTTYKVEQTEHNVEISEIH